MSPVKDETLGAGDSGWRVRVERGPPGSPSVQLCPRTARSPYFLPRHTQVDCRAVPAPPPVPVNLFFSNGFWGDEIDLHRRAGILLIADLLHFKNSPEGTF